VTLLPRRLPIASPAIVGPRPRPSSTHHGGHAQPPLVVAAAVMGTIFMLERLAAQGLRALALTHVT
jgi:hypothetical protein